MKNKYKNIKIIGNKTNNKNHPSSMKKKYFTHLQSNLKKWKPGAEQNAINKTEGKINTKKVMNKVETNKSSKGLKSSNKSYRNQSSVYE